MVVVSGKWLSPRQTRDTGSLATYGCHGCPGCLGVNTEGYARQPGQVLFSPVVSRIYMPPCLIPPETPEIPENPCCVRLLPSRACLGEAACPRQPASIAVRCHPATSTTPWRNICDWPAIKRRIPREGDAPGGPGTVTVGRGVGWVRAGALLGFPSPTTAAAGIQRWA